MLIHLRGSTSTNTFISAEQTQIKAALQYNSRWDFNCGKETKTIKKIHTSQCTENKSGIQDVHQIKFALACLTRRSVPCSVHTDCFKSGSSWKLPLSQPSSLVSPSVTPTLLHVLLHYRNLHCGLSLFLLHSSSIFSILAERILDPCFTHVQTISCS